MELEPLAQIEGDRREQGQFPTGGRVAEPQQRRVKGGPLKQPLFRQRRCTIARIADQGKPRSGELRTNLVGAAGLQTQPHQAETMGLA